MAKKKAKAMGGDPLAWMDDPSPPAGEHFAEDDSVEARSVYRIDCRGSTTSMVHDLLGT